MIGILQLTYTGCQHSNGLKVLKVGCMVMGSLINSEDEITDSCYNWNRDDYLHEVVKGKVERQLTACEST